MAEIRFTYISKGQYWRFRRGKMDCPLPGNPGDPAFHARYGELLALSERKAEAPAADSFSWLIGRYRKSPEFAALADSTQLDYDRTLDLIRDELGKEPFRHTTRAMIKAVQSDYAETPRKAHKIKQMISTLYTWADEYELVKPGFNPAKEIKRPKTKGGVKEIVVWSDFEIAAYIKAAPEHALTPVLLALYTGQRREDIVSMTWRQFQGDVIRVKQSKTKTLLDIACHPALRAHLTALKRRGVQICTNAKGLPYATANALSGAVRRVVEDCADMPDNRSMHGLKYAAGSMMEEAGCTIGQIQSVLGNRTYQMAVKYSTQRLRAKEAMAKLEASRK